MNEKEFLEEHPSLKTKQIEVCENCKDNYGNMFSILFMPEDIHETQIDKQKVKDAIKKIEDRLDAKYDGMINVSYEFISELRKELGI